MIFGGYFNNFYNWATSGNSFFTGFPMFSVPLYNPFTYNMPIWNTYSYLNYLPQNFYRTPIFQATNYQISNPYTQKTMARATAQPRTFSSSSGIGSSLVNFAKNLVNKSAAAMSSLMRNAGVKFHNRAWCADSMFYVVKQAIGNRMANWYKNCHYSACGTIYDAAKRNNAVVSQKVNGKISLANVKPGQLVLFDWQKGRTLTKSGTLDHVGMVESVDVKNGTFVTLEGNYSNKFSRVHRKLSDNNISAFIDIT